MNYILYIKALVKIILEFFLSLIFYLPFILLIKINKKKTNDILVIEKKYYDIKKKLPFHSEVKNSIEEFLLIDKRNLSVRIFYPDEIKTNFIVANLNFLKFFYRNYPKFIFFRSDWQDAKTLNISFYLMIILKIIEGKLIFHSHSGDPNWVNNQIRNKICKKVFDIHSFLPQIYIKKMKETKPMLEFGIPRKNFFEPSLKRKENIFYIGRLPKHDERFQILNFLKKNNVKINIYGEDTGNFINDKKDFFRIYKESKITINFPKQVKAKGITTNFAFRGRVLDAISHGVLLFDQKNPLMDLFFKAGTHYVHYDNEQDLLTKLNFYLKNYDTDGLKIAQNAFKLVQNEYSSYQTWSNIFNKFD